MFKLTQQLKWLCLGLILLSASLRANTATESEKELLANVFPTSCHFSGQFSQLKHIDGLPVPLLSEGDFFFSCDLGLVWNTHSPFNEVILFVNAAKNYLVDDEGEIQPLSGITQYILSKVLMRLLQGDTDYFAEEFIVTPAEGSEMLMLRPESYFMQKGIDNIQFKKNESLEEGVSLSVVVTDTTGQKTKVQINRIQEHEIDGRRSAFEQCKDLYPNSEQWCKLLRSPRRFEQKF